MTKSVKEQKRLLLVKDIIENDYNNITTDAIKVKLTLKDKYLKIPFTKEQREEILENIKHHLISTVKNYKLFEFKIIIELFEPDYTNIIKLRPNSYKVFNYNGKKILGELLFDKMHLGMKLVRASTSGKILTDSRIDFLHELLQKKLTSTLKINYKNITKIKSKTKVVEIKKIMNETLLFIKELEKNQHYIEIRDKYDLKYNISFYLNLENLDYHIELSHSFFNFQYIMNNKKTNIRYLYFDKSIEQKIINCFLNHGIINIECFESFNNEDVSLVGLIEYNDLLGY